VILQLPVFEGFADGSFGHGLARPGSMVAS
jgi:hypothetical protein